MRGLMSASRLAAAMAIVASTTGCGASNVVTSGLPSTTEAVLDSEFELAPGQTASLPGVDLTVRFDSITGDSRCPVDVVCVWSGNAGVLVTIKRSGTAAHQETLNSTVGAKSAQDGNETVTLLSLRPDPDTRHPFSPSEYRARFIVTSGS